MTLELQIEIALRSHKFVRQEFPVPVGLPAEIIVQIMDVLKPFILATSAPTPDGATLPLGMDFWWDKFCGEELPGWHRDALISPADACEFAKWFAGHCAETAKQYFEHAEAYEGR